jgi:hypothetical protein
MRRGAGFDADQARPEPLEERQDLGAAQLPLDDHGTLGIDAVHLKHVLGEVKTDRGNFAHRAAPIPRGC